MMGSDAMIFIFRMLSFNTAFSLSSFTLIKRCFSSSSLSAITVVSSTNLWLLILLAILIRVWESASPAFCTMYSAHELNKEGNSTQPWWTPFSTMNQSVFPCPVLTIASCPAYRFPRRQARWSDTSISLRIFHSLLWPTNTKALA